MVLIRTAGPSLAPFGIPNPLPDPVLTLKDGNGNTIFSNDNWKDTQETDIAATGLAPTDDKEAAILATLPPGPYTAIVNGNNNTTGVGIVEAYAIAGQ